MAERTKPGDEDVYVNTGTLSITLGDLTLRARGRIGEYHEVLLDLAENLFEQEQYSFAIVISHTACELLIERIITKAFSDKKITNLQNVIVSNSTSYNIAADRIKRLYIALTDDDKIGDQPFWKPFTDSVDRRNDIVHRGKMFEQDDAQKSLDAVKALIGYLDQQFGGS